MGFLNGPLAWISKYGAAQRAAYIAALSLVAIQVSIGIIMKTAQTGASYSFSTSGSVTISEFFKMLLSTFFFYRECKRRAAEGVKPSTQGLDSGYSTLPLSDSHDGYRLEETGKEYHRDSDSESGSSDEASRPPETSKEYHGDSDSESGSRDEASRPSETAGKEYHRDSDSESGSNDEASRVSPVAIQLNMRMFWCYIRGEVSREVRYGFCNLALVYVLINNSIFLSYKLADPGTIQLTKSGVTLITALVMIASLNTRISKIQWMAILMQICGLVVTQYQPDTGSTYSLSTYLILIFQVFLSASSGVYNQALLVADDSSLHADNMILYAAGTGINFLCHIVVKILKTDEPGFFQGYNSFSAIMVIVSNVFIGLAITAVYKYADAVVKCFATAFATGILLYIAPILFHTSLSAMVLPGTITVFVASWLYMDNPAPKDVIPSTASTQRVGIMGGLVALTKKYSGTFFAAAAIVTVSFVTALTMIETTMPDFANNTGVPTNASTDATLEVVLEPDQAEDTIISSPFKNTLAMIRWNSRHSERVPKLMEYQPFFHDIHISLPGLMEDQEKDYHNLTHDQSEDTKHIYNQVASTMKLILETEPEIDGLMYFHFDAWVDPFAFDNIDRENIQFPLNVNLSPDRHEGPEFRCMNTTQNYLWWGWAEEFHLKAMRAQTQLTGLDTDYVVDPNEWCIGWSDIYFIPRRFFADYILLADVFGSFEVFHEVAIPTMLHIIDQSRRSNPYVPVLDHISDCWGFCCARNPTAWEVVNFRCGHRLDYRAEEVTQAFYDKLGNQTLVLGKTVHETKVTMADSYLSISKNNTTPTQIDEPKASEISNELLPTASKSTASDELVPDASESGAADLDSFGELKHPTELENSNV